MLKNVCLAFFLLSSTVFGDITYNLVPSVNGPIDGLLFSPLGGDIELTNHVVESSGFVDFGLDYKMTNDRGDVFYNPHLGHQNLFILSNLLGIDKNKVIENAIFTETPKAINLGNGRYEFTSTIVGESIPDLSTIFDRPGNVDVVFNTTLTLGHQVESGSIFLGSSVPEPPSLLLTGVAAILVTLAFVSFKRFW